MRRTHGAVGFLLMAAAILGLALVDQAPAPIPLAIAQEDSGLLISSWQVGSYGVSVRAAANEQVVTVERDGQMIHTQRGVAFELAHARSGDGSVRLSPGRDLTGDGTPNLALSEWTGGAHCSRRVWVFELGEAFGVLEPIEAAHDGVAYFEDVDGDGRFAFRTHDWTFAHWRTSFASSPAPDVLLEYRNGAYRPAWARMQAPAQAEFSVQLQAVVGDPGWEDGEVPPALWTAMLDWLYGGQPQRAWDLLKRAWPANREGRGAFEAAFRAQLAKSPYWPAD